MDERQQFPKLDGWRKLSTELVGICHQRGDLTEAEQQTVRKFVGLVNDREYKDAQTIIAQ